MRIRLSLRELSRQTNISIALISLLENGKRNASDEMKKKLAKLYNCEVIDIFLALQLTQS